MTCRRQEKILRRRVTRNLPQMLEGVAPVYRAHRWPADDRAKPRMSKRVAPLVRERVFGGLSHRLADISKRGGRTEKISR